MESKDIIEHLQNSLSVILDRELTEFSSETRIFDDLGLNSMRFIELLMSLEDTLGLVMDPDSLEPEVFHSAGSLAEYIRTRLDPAAVG